MVFGSLSAFFELDDKSRFFMGSICGWGEWTNPAVDTGPGYWLGLEAVAVGVAQDSLRCAQEPQRLLCFCSGLGVVREATGKRLRLVQSLTGLKRWMRAFSNRLFK